MGGGLRIREILLEVFGGLWEREWGIFLEDGEDVLEEGF